MLFVSEASIVGNTILKGHMHRYEWSRDIDSGTAATRKAPLVNDGVAETDFFFGKNPAHTDNLYPAEQELRQKQHIKEAPKHEIKMHTDWMALHRTANREKNSWSTSARVDSVSTSCEERSGATIATNTSSYSTSWCEPIQTGLALSSQR